MSVVEKGDMRHGSIHFLATLVYFSALHSTQISPAHVAEPYKHHKHYSFHRQSMWQDMCGDALLRETNFKPKSCYHSTPPWFHQLVCLDEEKLINEWYILSKALVFIEKLAAASSVIPKCKALLRRNFAVYLL